MSLTSGRGPLSSRPRGHFSPPVPAGAVYVEPHRRRVRAVVGGQTVIDTEDVLLVHRQGDPPCYLFTTEEAGSLAGEPEPAAPGYVRVPWDAVDAWYEEEQEVRLHAPNPYHRVEVIAGCRRLVVELDGEVLVDTTDTVGVWETALEPRLYVARDHVRSELLRPSATTSYCPYKGTATWWSAVVGDHQVDDVAWSYEDPLPESVRIRGMLSFDEGRIDVRQDLPPG